MFWSQSIWGHRQWTSFLKACHSRSGLAAARERAGLDSASFCGPQLFVAKVVVIGGHEMCALSSSYRSWSKRYFGTLWGHFWLWTRAVRPLHKSLLKMEQTWWSPRCVRAHTSTWNMSKSNELHWDRNANIPPICVSFTPIFWNWYFPQVVQPESCFLKIMTEINLTFCIFQYADTVRFQLGMWNIYF